MGCSGDGAGSRGYPVDVRSRVGQVAAAVGAVGVQAVVLYAPRAPQVATGGLPVDKAVHLSVFALATAALAWAGVPRWLAVSAMALHAPLSEVVQDRLLPGRSGEPADIAADLLGVALGAWLVRPRAGRQDGPGAG